MKGSGCISGWCHLHSNVTVPSDIAMNGKMVDMADLIVYMFYCSFLKSTRRRMNRITEVTLQLVSSPAQAGPILASSMECDLWLDPRGHGGTWVLGREGQSIELCCRHHSEAGPAQTGPSDRSVDRHIRIHSPELSSNHLWLAVLESTQASVTPGIAWQSAPRNSKESGYLLLTVQRK